MKISHKKKALEKDLFIYLDSWLFPKKRNGPANLYEGWNLVIQENHLFKEKKTVLIQLVIFFNQKNFLKIEIYFKF